MREIRLTDRTVERDSLVSISTPADSGVLLLDFAVDTITHQPLVKGVQVQATPAMSLNYMIKDKRLEVKAKTKPPDVIVKYKTIEVYKPHLIYQDVVHEVRELYPYQKFLMYVGIIALLYLLIKLIITLKIK